jgi:hypothetical protein
MRTSTKQNKKKRDKKQKQKKLLPFFPSLRDLQLFPTRSKESLKSFFHPSDEELLLMGAHIIRDALPWVLSQRNS